MLATQIDIVMREPRIRAVLVRKSGTARNCLIGLRAIATGRIAQYRCQIDLVTYLRMTPFGQETVHRGGSNEEVRGNGHNCEHAKDRRPFSAK